MTFSNAFFNENIWILISNSLKFTPKGPINNISALVHIMAWRRPGDKHYLNKWWWDYRCVYASLGLNELTHWGWVTHIFGSNIKIIGSDNGLSLGWHQAIIWTNAGILLTGPLGTNFSEILIAIHNFHSRKCISTYHPWNDSHFVSVSMFQCQ